VSEALTTAGLGQPHGQEHQEAAGLGLGRGLLLTPAGQRRAEAFPAPATTRRGSLPKVLLATADMVAVAIGLAIASAVQHSADSAVLALLSLPVWLTSLANHGVYRARNVRHFGTEVRSLLQAATLSMTATALMGVLLEQYVSRRWLVLGFVTATVALVAERAAARAVFADLRRRGRLTRRVVAVGADADGCELVEMLAHRRHGYQVVGFADDVLPTGAVPVGEVPVLGTTGEVAALVKATGADSVLVSTSALEPAQLNALARALGDSGVHVELSTPLRSVSAQRLSVRSVGTRFSVLHLEPSEGPQHRTLGKRAFDVVVAGVGLVLAAPVLLVAAAAIKLDTRGPVLFRQNRLGKDGCTFPVLKLRSMVVDAEKRLEELSHLNEVQWPLFKLKRDPRTTRVGRVIRALSVDELPQLWNVLRGEMSLVRPRAADAAGAPPPRHQPRRAAPALERAARGDEPRRAPAGAADGDPRLEPGAPPAPPGPAGHHRHVAGEQPGGRQLRRLRPPRPLLRRQLVHRHGRPDPAAHGAVGAHAARRPLTSTSVPERHPCPGSPLPWGGAPVRGRPGRPT